MVLTGYFVISPVIGLSCHRRRRDAKHRRQLDAGVEASGPHDFAVRFGVVRLSTLSRPPHPAPNVRDDGETPLLWAPDAEDSAGDLGLRSIAANCGRLARRAKSPPPLHACHALDVKQAQGVAVRQFEYGEQTCRASGKSGVYCYHGARNHEDMVRCMANAP